MALHFASFASSTSLSSGVRPASNFPTLLCDRPALRRPTLKRRASRPTPGRVLPILTTTREPPHGLVPCTRADFSLLCTSDISLSWPAMQQPVPGLSVDSSLSCPLPAARPHLRQIARVSSCCRVTVCTAPDVPDWARACSNPSGTRSSDQHVERREHRRHSRAPGSALHF